MKNWGHSLALLGTWMLIPLGCSTADNVDLGATKGSALVDYADSWDGYAEAYKFDGTTSDRIRISLDANGDGSLEVGEQALFPPPTDFEVGYPPGDVFPYGSASDANRLRPGFRYPVHGARIEGGRLRLYVEPNDPFTPWCEHQTPYGHPDLQTPPQNYYMCVPPVSIRSVGDTCQFTPETGPAVPVDCGKVAFCSFQSVCVCTATGCTISHQEEPELVQLDATLTAAGTTMVGTLVVPPNPTAIPTAVPSRITVRLTRN